jgi:hypothetical protein
MGDPFNTSSKTEVLIFMGDPFNTSEHIKDLIDLYWLLTEFPLNVNLSRKINRGNNPWQKRAEAAGIKRNLRDEFSQALPTLLSVSQC